MIFTDMTTREAKKVDMMVDFQQFIFIILIDES